MRSGPNTYDTFQAFRNQVWPAAVLSSLAFGDAGLMLGAGTCLARMTPGGLALDTDRARLLALLSVADGRSARADMLAPIAAAASHWQRGDKALAQLRLAVAGLPRLDTPAAAESLRQAAALLDDGLPPGALMKALGFDAAVLEKYDPDQPRVPGGSGRASGRWTSGGVANGPALPIRDTAPAPPIFPIAADDPVSPRGLAVIPHNGFVDPLDPANLNTPLSLAEQQAIADTVSMIRADRTEDLVTLRPHPYDNNPHKETGARLPSGTQYTTNYARSAGSPPGNARIIRGSDGSTYFTRNHYRSFYPVDVIEKACASERETIRSLGVMLKHQVTLFGGDMPKYVVILEVSKQSTPEHSPQAIPSSYRAQTPMIRNSITGPREKTVFDVDGSRWTHRRDIYESILPLLEAPPGYDGGINGLFEWMFWDERATVEPPYVVRLHGTASLPPDVAEELGWILDGVKSSRDWEAARGRLVEAYIEVVDPVAGDAKAG